MSIVNSRITKNSYLCICQTHIAMEVQSPYIEELKTLLSKSVMRPMAGPKDFKYLYNAIKARSNETVGENTLRRLWGYIDGYETVRESTLDALCRFVGFPDWHTFVADYCGKQDFQTSHSVVTATLTVEQLSVGDRLAIEWNPNRRLVLRHLGDGVFLVTEACNSKIMAGDRFHCERFIIGEPLYIDNLVQSEKEPTLFVVGKQGGLTKVEIL